MTGHGILDYRFKSRERPHELTKKSHLEEVHMDMGNAYVTWGNNRRRTSLIWCGGYTWLGNAHDSREKSGSNGAGGATSAGSWSNTMYDFCPCRSSLQI